MSRDLPRRVRAASVVLVAAWCVACSSSAPPADQASSYLRHLSPVVHAIPDPQAASPMSTGAIQEAYGGRDYYTAP